MIFIILQRFAELLYSNYNTKKLLKNGAKEYNSKHPVEANSFGKTLSYSCYATLGGTRSAGR